MKAAGNKLEKRTVETSPTSKTTTTTYLGGSVYQNDSLQFIGHEEGRVRAVRESGSPEVRYVYDYFVKDHLGNTRVVLTDEQRTDAYPVASLEAATINTEKLYYNIPDDGATRVNKNTVAGYPTDSYTNPNDYIQKLNGNGTKIGTSITLKVMSGDSYNIRANSWYRNNGASPSSPVSPLNSIITALSNGIVGTGATKATAAALQSSNTLDPAITNFLNNQTNITTRPKAYLNWVLLDEQFKYVNGGYEQVGDNEEFKTHIRSNLPITRNGYLYVYVSNETPNIDVFFDNVQVTHTRGPLLSEDHYYAFGLRIASISSQSAGSMTNKRKFNAGSELQNEEFSDGSGLELYATPLRSLDPQLGRWWQIDSKPDYAQSLYSSMGNNPILNNDPLGDTAWPIKNQWNAQYVKQFSKELSNTLKALNSSEQKFTCDDLALQTIVSFSSKNNLPFKWETGSGTFDATDDKYTNTKDFLLDVKQHSGAPDFVNNSNTTLVGLQDIQPGTLNVLTSEGNKSPNHIQVISSVQSDGTPSMLNGFKAGVTSFVAAQGNFKGGLFGGRLLGSDNPNSMRYVGTPVQAGEYNIKTNTWVSPQTGITTNFIGGHYTNQYRNFNFLNFNRK